MTHIVLPGCINCKHTDCVEVCPVDCFHEGENMLVINPDICIDCGACVPICPEEAIAQYDHDAENPVHNKWLSKNVEMVNNGWPVITKKTNPMNQMSEFTGMPDKEVFFSINPGTGDQDK